MSSSDYLLDISREYALYVCGHRAIPAVQDGLKHGQRISLWLMRNRADKIKTVALGGLMSAERLYVHGDVSATAAIGMLAAPYKNNVPLIEGLGQFGNRVAPVEGIGAPRYTEVRRAKAAELILYRDLDLVPLEDNYDGSNKQPIHFLPLIPTILLNGVTGVAVGYSTEIMPRSLKGLVLACQDALDSKDKIRGLEPFYERYDITVKPLGANQYEFTGKVVVEDHTYVKINELPPGMSIENFRKRLNQLEEEERIQAYIDRSAEVIDITVRFKRGTIAGWTEQQAIEFFKLKEKNTERIVCIDWDGKAVRTYNDAADLVRDFVAWRLGWYTKRFEKLTADTMRERIYWQAVKTLFDAGFTQKLGTFSNRDAVETEVLAITTAAELVLEPQHLDRVVSLPTYRWTQAFHQDVLAKITELTGEIAEYEEILASPERLTAVYVKELDEIKKLK